MYRIEFYENNIFTEETLNNLLLEKIIHSWLDSNLHFSDKFLVAANISFRIYIDFKFSFKSRDGIVERRKNIRTRNIQYKKDRCLSTDRHVRSPYSPSLNGLPHDFDRHCFNTRGEIFYINFLLL